MKTRSNIFSSPAAFTLIELLTVIAIIAILMGLLFPAVGAVKENARKVQARNDVMQIVAAVKAYYTEYGKYPPLTAPGAGGGKGQEGGTTDEFIGDPVSGAKEVNSKLFNTLRAIPDDPNESHKLNPRRVVFFEGKSVSNPDAPRAGFMDKVGGKGGSDRGSFFDPWGKQYNVMLDTNYDNILDVNQCYTDFSDTDKPRTQVGAFALGKDNKIGENGDGRFRNGQKVSDDVISWQ